MGDDREIADIVDFMGRHGAGDSSAPRRREGRRGSKARLVGEIRSIKIPPKKELFGGAGDPVERLLLLGQLGFDLAFDIGVVPAQMRNKPSQERPNRLHSEAADLGYDRDRFIEPAKRRAFGRNERAYFADASVGLLRSKIEQHLGRIGRRQIFELMAQARTLGARAVRNLVDSRFLGRQAVAFVGQRREHVAEFVALFSD
jgi:hypothetical protein